MPRDDESGQHKFCMPIRPTVSHSKYLRCMHGTAVPSQQAAADDAEWIATLRLYVVLGLCPAWDAAAGRLCGAVGRVGATCAAHSEIAYERPQRGAQR